MSRTPSLVLKAGISRKVSNESNVSFVLNECEEENEGLGLRRASSSFSGGYSCWGEDPRAMYTVGAELVQPNNNRNTNVIRVCLCEIERSLYAKPDL